MSIIGFGHYVEKQEYAHLFDKVTAASIIIIYAIAMMLYLIHRRARFFFLSVTDGGHRIIHHSIKLKGLWHKLKKASRAHYYLRFGSLFLICGERLRLVRFCYTVLVINIDSKLPIVLFVG